MKIAYLTSMYPDVSHTFIVRETRAMRSLGVEVATFSIRRPDDRNVLGADARREAAATRWLVLPSAAQLLSASVWVLGTRPARMVRTFCTAVGQRGMTLRQRVKWACYFAEAVLLAYWLTTETFDHLHCHFGNSGSSTGSMAARLAGVSFSMTCHGSELHEIDKHRLPEKVTQAAFVACVSEHGKAQLMLACRPEDWDKMHVVRCGVPQVDVISADQSNGQARILCVGRLSPEKGHLVLLDALARLRERGMNFHCTLVGDGPMRSTIVSRARRLRLTESLTLTGPLEPDRVAEHYQSADVVVSASLSEGVPVVLMEALARARPVVATRVGGVPELIRDGWSGLVVAPGDADALGQALCKILEAPKWAHTLGCHGARYVREEFSIEASAHRLMELFNQAHRLGVPHEAPAGIEQASCPPRLTPVDS